MLKSHNEIYQNALVAPEAVKIKTKGSGLHFTSGKPSSPYNGLMKTDQLSAGAGEFWWWVSLVAHGTHSSYWYDNNIPVDDVRKQFVSLSFRGNNCYSNSGFSTDKGGLCVGGGVHQSIGSGMISEEYVVWSTQQSWKISHGCSGFWSYPT